MGIGSSVAMMKSQIDGKESSIFSIAECFDIYIWIFMIACLTFTIFNFFSKNFGSIYNLIDFIFITLFNQSKSKLKFKKFSFLITIWLLMMKILILNYKTVLLSNLVSIEPSNINSFEDLSKQPQVEVIGFKGGSSTKIICGLENEDFKKICRRTKRVTEYSSSIFRNVILGKAVLFAAKTWINQLAQQYPSLMIHTIREDTNFISPSLIYNKKLDLKIKNQIDLLI